MSAKSNYFENKLIDAVKRAQPFVIGSVQLQWVQTSTAPAVAPPTFYIGILAVSPWTALTPVASGAFIIRPDSSGKLHLLKCTTAGTTAAQAPIAMLTNDAIVNDGSAVWTDQYTALEAGVLANLPNELSGSTYARQPIVAGLSTISGTQLAGSETASTGINATSSNNNQLVFNSGGGSNGDIGLFAWFDALTGGNLLEYGFITGGSLHAPTNSTVTFPPSSLSFQEDN
jgi:hypothetical protein